MPRNTNSVTASVWLVRMLRCISVLSLLMVPALVFVFFSNTFPFVYQRDVIFWRLLPLAAGIATLCGSWLSVKTGKHIWLLLSFVAWLPNLLLFVVAGMFAQH